MTSEQGLARVRGVLRRRRLWVVATATVVLVASALTIGRLRPVYKASAVLRALESQPSHEYVPPTAAEQVGERLRTLRLGVMARPILEQVVDELHLDQALRRPRDAVIDEVRARMEVKLEGDDTYLLTYEDSDPVRAREVVNHATAHFVSRQVERRALVTAATEEALAAEVARLRPELQRLERGVREFKYAHDGSLPEQQEPNLRTLDQTTLEINILSTNVDTAEERRRQILIGAGSPMRHQEALLETELHDALTKYTPEHPEVQRIRAELEKVAHQRVVEEQRLRQNAEGSPELLALSSEVARGRALLDALRKRQEEVRKRLVDTAKNGQALAEMSTELEAIRHKYQTALSKLHDAELAASVDRNLREQRFDTVEGAAQPLHPVRPNRPLLALGALLLAGLLGLGAGFARDFADPSIHSPEELATLGPAVDVLACVPEIDDGETT